MHNLMIHTITRISSEQITLTVIPSVCMSYFYFQQVEHLLRSSCMCRIIHFIIEYRMLERQKSISKKVQGVPKKTQNANSALNLKPFKHNCACNKIQSRVN